MPDDKKKRAKKSQDEDSLEPLDLEGTDFEDLLDEPAEASSPKPVPVRKPRQRKPVERSLGEVPRVAAEPPKDTASEVPGGPSQSEGVFVSDAYAPVEESADEVSSRDELLIGGAGAVLAATTLMPWYRSGSRELTGLGSGSFGAVAFVVGVLIATIIVLRKTKTPLRFPFEHGVVVEMLGYVGIGSVILKRFLKPGDTFSVVGVPTVVALIVAGAVIFLASKLSPGAPFVVRPGWLNEAGGTLGAGLLAGALVVAGIFAVIKPGGSTTIGGTGALEYLDKLPECASKFGWVEPKLVDMDSYFATNNPEGAGQLNVCGGKGTTNLTPKDAAKRWRNLLSQAGWTVEPPTITPNVTILRLSDPTCGTISLARPIGAEGGADAEITQATFSLTPCFQGQVPGR